MIYFFSKRKNRDKFFKKRRTEAQRKKCKIKPNHCAFADVISFFGEKRVVFFFLLQTVKREREREREEREREDHPTNLAEGRRGKKRKREESEKDEKRRRMEKLWEL